jgi:hypothetical protein
MFYGTVNSPAIIVKGGTLILENDVIFGTPLGSRPVIEVDGGTLVLGGPNGTDGSALLSFGSEPFISVSGGGKVIDNGGNGYAQASSDGTPQATAMTGIQLVSSAPNAVAGQTVTFTATVTAAGAPASDGSVNFSDSTTGADLGTVPVDNGSASVQAVFNSVTAGDQIVATYIPTSGALRPSSGQVTQVVSKDGTTTSLSASLSGQVVTFTATVTANAPGSGTPTGTVDFFDTTTNTDLTPGGVPLSSGTAMFSTASLDACCHTIEASYSGDSNFEASSNTLDTIAIFPSIVVLDPSSSGALSLSANANIQLGGGVYVDSRSSSALTASGNSTINASVIQVRGGVRTSGGASLSPAPITGAPIVPDPLADLPGPNTVGPPQYGIKNFSGSSTATIGPGVYLGIAVSDNAKLTLSSGVYYIGLGGLSVSGAASITGSRVTIVNLGSLFPFIPGLFGSINLGGTGSSSLSASTSGPYAGIAILQPHFNDEPITINGSATLVSGTVYAPSARLFEAGNAQLNGAVVVDDLTITGNGVIAAVDAALSAIPGEPAPEVLIGDLAFEQVSGTKPLKK